MTAQSQTVRPPLPPRAPLVLDPPTPALKPNTKFIAWMQKVGISRLARLLGVNKTTVNYWKERGEFHSIIKPKNAATCIVLSQHAELLPADGKPLTFDDIYCIAEAVQQ